MNSLVVGYQSVHVLLQNYAGRVQCVWLSALARKRHPEIETLVRKVSVKMRELSAEQMDSMAPDVNHQGVIAECKQRSYQESDIDELIEDSDSPFILILDGVQDPHNLGACLRSANAAGVDMVIAPKDNAVSITPVVTKVAAGAVGITPFIQVTNLARTIKHIQQLGVWVYGATEGTDNTLFNMDCKGPIGIVLGAEGRGLRRLTRDTCDDIFTIPTFGVISSLNVSVATGVCLFEVAKQRIR